MFPDFAGAYINRSAARSTVGDHKGAKEDNAKAMSIINALHGEGAYTDALMKKYGFHQMRHCFGFLRELISFSIAKLERHIDLCRQTDPGQSPSFDIDPYDMEGFDVIMRNGSQANYMRDDHTLKNTGKCFLE